MLLKLCIFIGNKEQHYVQNCKECIWKLCVTNLSIIDFLLLLIPTEETQSECQCNCTEVNVVEAFNGDKYHSFITFCSSLQGISFYTKQQGHCILDGMVGSQYCKSCLYWFHVRKVKRAYLRRYINQLRSASFPRTVTNYIRYVINVVGPSNLCVMTSEWHLSF